MHADIALNAELQSLRNQLAQANAEKEFYQKMVEEIQSSDCFHSKAQLFTLVHGFQYALLLEDEQRKIVMANEQFCQLFSIPAPPEALVGADCSQSAEQVKHLFEESETFVTRIAELLIAKLPAISEELVMKDGRHLLRDYIPVKDKDGRYLGHYWVYQDITKTRLAQKESLENIAKLDKQKEFYESILNSLPTDIVAFDPQQKYLFVNPLGITNPELRKWMIGKTDYDYCAYRNKPISIADSRKEKFELVKSTGKPINWEEKLIDEQGRPHYFIRHMFPVFDEQGDISLVLGYGVNITERKKMEEQLEKSEELYRLVIESANDGIWDWDIKSDYVYYNRRLQQMFGYKEKEFEPSLQMWYKIIHPDDLKIAQEILKEHLEHNKPFYYKLRFFHKNGGTIWIMCRGFALRDEKGVAYRMVGSYTDVTDLKETEETLKKAKEAAEEASKSKEIFFANMSHEIRTPLNGIIGLAKLLSKTELNSTQNGYLKAIRYSADNLLVIINDILDLAKMEAGKLAFETVDFDLGEIVQNAMKSLTYKADEKGIRLLHSFPNEQVIVKGDPFRLTQILTNLLNNAIKFTTNGTVQLKTQLHHLDREVQLHFDVKDTGIGIAPNKLATIFNSFTQAQHDTARKYGGTGLGLAICKNLVEMQGGAIRVESEFGKGSTFSFDLAYMKGCSENVQIAESETSEFKHVQSARILLAEDNEVNQFLASELLTSWGMEVDTACNGLEAIEKWKAHDYDMILMDIQMPELGGIEATIEIRNAQLPKSNVPIIALTANAMKGQKERFIGLGMNDYVAKPFNENELYQKMIALLPEKSAQLPTPKKLSRNTYDIKSLERITNGSAQFEKRIMGIFLDTVPDSITKLKQYVSQENKEGISVIAHKIKTTVNAMSIDQLKEPIQELEDLASMKKEMQELRTRSELVIEVLEDIIEQFKAKVA